MNALPPHVVAVDDQDRAELAALVREARKHHRGCPNPSVCAGRVVGDVLQEVDAEELGRLLQHAVAQLAAVPGDPAWLEDALALAEEGADGGCE